MLGKSICLCEGMVYVESTGKVSRRCHCGRDAKKWTSTDFPTYLIDEDEHDTHIRLGSIVAMSDWRCGDQVGRSRCRNEAVMMPSELSDIHEVVSIEVYKPCALSRRLPALYIRCPISPSDPCSRTHSTYCCHQLPAMDALVNSQFEHNHAQSINCRTEES